MMIKNSGYISGMSSNPYTVKKTEQTVSAAEKSNAVKLDKISAPAKNLDTIEISQFSVNNQPSLVQTRDAIVSELKQDKDISFLDTLRAQIQSNQYQIDSKELAKIMLTGR